MQPLDTKPLTSSETPSGYFSRSPSARFSNNICPCTPSFGQINKIPDEAAKWESEMNLPLASQREREIMWDGESDGYDSTYWGSVDRPYSSQSSSSIWSRGLRRWTPPLVCHQLPSTLSMGSYPARGFWDLHPKKRTSTAELRQG